MNFYPYLKVFIVLLFTLAINHSLYSQCTDGDIILNGDFETGDLSGWTVMDIMNPFFPLGVDCSGSFTTDFSFNSITPLDGTCMAVNGFDGDGPGQITMHQTVTIPAGASATFTFSWWVAYDMFNFGGSTLDRMFEVQIQPVGGGAPISIPYSFSAPAGTLNNGSGWVTVTLNLSAFAGQTFWLCFVETIPENFTGPAQVAIDGVSLIIECPCLADNGSLAIKATQND